MEGPQQVMQLLSGAQASAVVASAIQLGIFAAAQHDDSVDAIAKRIDCPERSTRIVLDALVAFGLLAREGERYRLTPPAAAHLVPGQPAYVGDIANIILGPQLWEGLGRLSEAVRAGGTVLDTHAETERNPFWEMFARSSAAMAMPSAQQLAKLLEGHIAGKEEARVLDVAAGSGLYGFTLAKNPKVKLTSLDWPNVIPETRKWAERMGVHNTHYLEGNLFELDWRGPYDVIVMSHIFHHFDRPTCERLMTKAAAALAPGGKVAVQEFLADQGGELFSITMLVTTRHGEAYRSDDYRGWFAAAGLPAPSLHVIGPTAWLIS
jgi:C-methyltransferase